MTPKKIGLILETKKDAKQHDAELDLLRHWREPGEIETIRDTIQSCGHEVKIVGDPRHFLENFHDYEDIDFLFNLSVGFLSRFRLGLAPSLFEVTDVPYSGADPYTKIATQNKHLFKSFLDKRGIPTPNWIYLQTPEELDDTEPPPFPSIVKHSHEGSSIGLDPSSVVHDSESLDRKVDEVFSRVGGPIIVESFVRGRELKLGLIGNEEIKFKGMIEDVDEGGQRLGDQFLYFDAKKHNDYGKKPREIGDEAEDILKDALRIYEHFLPVDFGTFDIRVNEEGEHFFLEFNADATLHPERTLAMCGRLNGISYRTLIEKILLSSFERWGITS